MKKQILKNVVAGSLAVLAVGGVTAGTLAITDTVKEYNKANALEQNQELYNNINYADFAFEDRTITAYYGKLSETLVLPSCYTNNGLKTMEVQLNSSAETDEWAAEMIKRKKQNTSSSSINFVYYDDANNSGVIDSLTTLQDLSLYVAKYPVTVKYKDYEYVEGSDTHIRRLAINWGRFSLEEREKVKKLVLPEAFAGFSPPMSSSGYINNRDYTITNQFPNLEVIEFADVEGVVDKTVSRVENNALIGINNEILTILPQTSGRYVMPANTTINEEFGEIMLANTKITEFVFNDTCSFIPACFSGGGDMLEKIVLGKNCQVIGAYAFAYEENLKSVDFSNATNLRIIRQNAFEGASVTGDVVIPASVTTIEGSAFSRCNISSLTFLGRINSFPTSVDSLGITTTTPVYVRADDLEYYQGKTSNINWTVIPEESVTE